MLRLEVAEEIDPEPIERQADEGCVDEAPQRERCRAEVERMAPRAEARDGEPEGVQGAHHEIQALVEHLAPAAVLADGRSVVEIGHRRHAV